MQTDNVQICGILRNFESDSEYLSFEDFWIEKLADKDREQLCRDLKYFTNYPGDKYLVARRYYIGRGKSFSVLQDNARMFFFPLFRAMKLFQTGDLIMPLGFYSWNKKWHEMRFQGENYGHGYGLKGQQFFFKQDNTEAFSTFRIEVEKYLTYIDLSGVPYKKYKPLENIDTRCFFAIHLFLKESVENNNPFMIFDRLIDYTMGLESLYLHRRDEEKRKLLSSRIAVLLSKNDKEEEQICQLIKRFYDIRSNIVHASLIDEKESKYLSANIYEYEDIFRKSILAFLELNSKNPTKEQVINLLDESVSSPNLKKEIQNSLSLLKMAL